MSGFRFADAVSAVQAAIRPRSSSHSAQPGGSAAQSPGTDARDYTLAPAAERPSGADDFPHIDDARLYALIPSFGFDKAADERAAEARRVVRAALDEMKLNYDLDTMALGDRSDLNKGCAEIVKILARVRLQAPEQDSAGRRRGQLSRDLPEDGPGGRDEAATEEEVTLQGSSGMAKRAYETHDLLRAIDRKDVETIMAIRDANFDLLLDLGGGSAASTTKSNTPLGYAMGLGKEYDGVCIVITGIFSKFVNTLPDPEEEDLSQHDAVAGGAQRAARRPKLKRQLDPRTMSRLRKVKANLKLAIDSSLQLNQTSLLASYCQVLVMSEGDGFIRQSVYAVGHPLRARIVGGGSSVGHGDVITSSHPFVVARTAVMQFVGEALRSKRERIAAVGDYVDNACGDLILMAMWDAVRLEPAEKEALSAAEQESLHAEITHPLPAYFFARDERVTSHFIERITELGRALDMLRTLDPTKVPKSARRPAMVKRAGEVVEALGSSIRSRSATERLEVLRSIITR